MITRRRARTIALLGAVAMLLSACSLPRIPGLGGGNEIGSTDVITISHTSAGMFGYFGGGSTEIAEDTITSRFSLPNGAKIYVVTEELTAENRALIEQAAQDYLEWEWTVSERRRNPCTDIASDRIEVSGSITHESTMQDCSDGNPLRALKRSVRHIQGDLPDQLAHPTENWTIELRPWADDGPDKSAEVERYELTRAVHKKGMPITVQNAPAGWGKGLEESSSPGQKRLGWDHTGDVLTALNQVRLHEDQIGCGDQTGEVTVTKEGKPALVWTHRVCPGQTPEALVEVLRAI